MPKHGWVEKNHVNAVVKALVSWLPVRHGCANSLCTPSTFSLGLFDHFTLLEQDPNSRVGHFLSYANGHAYRDRLESDLTGVTSQASEKPEAPVRAEPHPTAA